MVLPVVLAHVGQLFEHGQQEAPCTRGVLGDAGACKCNCDPV